MNKQGPPTARTFAADWKKSSWSQGENACVEVASGSGITGVRDSKQRGSGPILTFEPELWGTFVDKLKSGQFDLA